MMVFPHNAKESRSPLCNNCNNDFQWKENLGIPVNFRHGESYLMRLQAIMATAKAVGIDSLVEKAAPPVSQPPETSLPRGPAVCS